MFISVLLVLCMFPYTYSHTAEIHAAAKTLKYMQGLAFLETIYQSICIDRKNYEYFCTRIRL